MKVGGTHPTGMLSCYRLQQSCGQGYVITRVCDSVNRGGSASVHAGIPPPSPEQTPPSGSRLWHTVHERPVHILLECILVMTYLYRARPLTKPLDPLLVNCQLCNDLQFTILILENMKRNRKQIHHVVLRHFSRVLKLNPLT